LFFNPQSEIRNPQLEGMVLVKRRRIGIYLVGLLIAAVLAYNPIADLILASRLLLAVRALASGATGEGLPVAQAMVQRTMGDRRLQAILYRPSGSSPKRSVMLLAGVSELGCYHPRLRALSRALADKGFMVLAPDIEMFRRFEVTPAALDEILFWYEQIPTLEGAGDPLRRGIIGISFSGTLALITSARPGVRDSLSFVMGIGAYQDLARCAQTWFGAGPRTAGEGYYPTRYYGRWIIMLAALDMLEREEERRFLGDALVNLLLQKPPPHPPETLGAQARRWYQLATMQEDRSDHELALAIETHLQPLFQRLSPDEAASRARCPVFLAHGAHDDLIVPEESKQLYKRLKDGRAYLLISPFLTHTHPLNEELALGEKTRAVWDMLGFFYQFARAAR
jgi:dienelactone hydrolase